MNLYVIRHADAGDPAGWFGADADRPLTPLGRAQAHALGEAFRRRGVAVGVVVSSPLVRAKQTADGFADGFGGVTVQTSDLLAPGEFRKRKLLEAAAAVGADDVAVVGHNPDLSAYLGWLTGSDAAFDLPKGGVAAIEFRGAVEKGEGRLVWLVSPEWYMAPS